LSAGGCGFAGVDVVGVGVVLVVLVDVAVDAGVLDEGAEIVLALSPALVTTNVMARINAPRAAMMAGRGSSIRGALGTVQVERSGKAYCVFGT
jgi:hypothetical protein